jgi:hypothetical protein
MLAFVKSDRKLRLFAVSCCRLILHLVSDSRCIHAVDMAERCADGLSNYSELNEAWKAVWELAIRTTDDALWTISNATDPDDQAAECQSFIDGYAYSEPTGDSKEEAEAALLRDIFGNPFRPVTAVPDWLTSTVTQLAKSIYQDRTFDRLPILADALQDAGCNNADILAHCRQGGVHVRGCWVVDLLLGKG